MFTYKCKACVHFIKVRGEHQIHFKKTFLKKVGVTFAIVKFTINWIENAKKMFVSL